MLLPRAPLRRAGQRCMHHIRRAPPPPHAISACTAALHRRALHRASSRLTAPHRVCAAPDGDTLVTADALGGLAVWRLLHPPSGSFRLEPRGRLASHATPVRSVACDASQQVWEPSQPLRSGGPARRLESCQRRQHALQSAELAVAGACKCGGRWVCPSLGPSTPAPTPRAPGAPSRHTRGRRPVWPRRSHADQGGDGGAGTRHARPAPALVDQRCAACGACVRPQL